MAACLSLIVTVLTLFLVCHSTLSCFQSFQCYDKSGNVPALPKAYSANIRINFLNEKYTVEMKYAKNEKEGKQLIEFKGKDRHVKYITRRDQKSTLFILYREKEYPVCKVVNSDDIASFMKNEDVGEHSILLKALDVMLSPEQYNLYSIEPNADTGVYAIRYERCLSDPKMNISISFAEKTWTHAIPSESSAMYPEVVVAEIGYKTFTALYSYFDPSVPTEDTFQPPSDVFCDGFRDKKSLPKIPNFFSYDAEVVYETTNGKAPLVSQRKVYYDLPSEISRVDLNDGLSEGENFSSRITAQKKTIIHDFNSGVQYIFDPFTGKCTIDTFRATFDAIWYKTDGYQSMLTGTKFFWMDGAKTSYNGLFPVRGMMADVYTALRVDPKTKKPFIISWYFSTEQTQVVENEKVEKNVLLRMHVRPETIQDEDVIVDINFFNFVKAEPNVFTYDLSSCYNDSSSTTLVFTFPAIEELQGSEKLIGMLIHLAIKDVTRIKKQQINMKEVIFTGGYMYAEFSLLAESPLKRIVPDLQVTLDDALKKLRDSVSNGKFSVKVPTENNIHILIPEPNGLNIFAGDRIRNAPKIGYNQGGVISLTIAMLFLGFLMGLVTLNLIMSKKHGVSLFQKSRLGNKGFSGELNESSM